MPVADRLVIRRLDARYLVAANHPAPESVRQRLDAALATVGRDLGAALSPLATGDAGGIWLVRRVDLDHTLDTDLPTERLARDWARNLAAAIARKLDRTADGVVFFADPTAHLARFMADLAAGDAWSLWYHGRFAGLKALPVAMALRTVILAEPEHGLRALARLPPAELGRVLDALGAAEARRIVEGFAEAPSAEAATVLLAHLEAEGWPAQSPACPERLALALLIALTASAGPARPVALARAMAWLRHRVALGADLAVPLVRGDSPASLLTSRDAERLLPLLAAPVALRQRLAHLAVPEPALAAPAIGVERFTPFGGSLMLLCFVDELPLDAFKDWPTAAGAGADTVVRTLVLAKCAGGMNALAFLLDPVWRDLLGLPPALLPAQLAPWCRAVDRPMRAAWRRALRRAPRRDCNTGDFLALPRSLCPSRGLDRLLGRAAGHVLDRFAAHLPGFAGSSPAYLARNFLAVPARVEAGPDGLCATLGRPPLDVVLAMTGLGRTRLELPWLRPTRLELRREG
jgi:hypothetical protein